MRLSELSSDHARAYSRLPQLDAGQGEAGVVYTRA